MAVTVAITWMKKKAPALLKERMKRKKDAKKWDKIFMSFYSIFLIAILILPGLDAVRFRWSYVPLIVKILAFIGYFPGFWLVFWAMRENAFLSDVVRIQEERGHTFLPRFLVYSDTRRYHHGTLLHPDGPRG